MSLASSIVIRRAGTNDCASLGGFFEKNKGAETERHFNPFPLARETASRLMQEAVHDEYYIACCEDKVVGLAMLRGFDEGYRVPSFGILVDVDYRRMGVGEALIKHALHRALALGLEKVRLSVYRDNTGAIELYRKHGFETDDEESKKTSRTGPDKLIMIKKCNW